MESGHHSDSQDLSLCGRVRQATGEYVFKCYQCGKCSAGCPLGMEMDYPPSQIIRMIQLGFPGLEEKALSSRTIWLCLTCETCQARCPKEVDLPKIMDFLRQESLRRGLAHPDAKKIISFHRAFLDSVEYTGRLFEMGLIVDYKIRNPGRAFQDVLVAPKMFLKGKLKPMPHLLKGRSNIGKIFQKAWQKEKNK